MIINSRDFKDILREVRFHYEIGCDKVLFPLNHMRKDELHFCMGSFDEALFYHDHPYDREQYQSFDVRSLYETLVLMDKGKLLIDGEKIKKISAANTLIQLDFGERKASIFHLDKRLVSGRRNLDRKGNKEGRTFLPGDNGKRMKR